MTGIRYQIGISCCITIRRLVDKHLIYQRQRCVRWQHERRVRQSTLKEWSTRVIDGKEECNA